MWKCPVCQSNLLSSESEKSGKDMTHFVCPKCGEFILSNTLVDDLPSKIRTDKNASIKISHAIRLMQQSNKIPELYANTIDKVLKINLPKPKEQADLLIRWIAENISSPGKTIEIKSGTHMSIIGASSDEGFALVINHLFDNGMLRGHNGLGLGGQTVSLATLSFDGWDYYEQLRLGEKNYRKAFMAMKFGDQELNTVVDLALKPAALSAGFDLNLLLDTPKAGLIDDRLRVEIQASDFVIADLTHDNLGAYWEAGYAEGLGKPVIYTCKKSKFEDAKTHFDTNHHLTVTWSIDNLQQVIDDLKSTIRATLPHLAKQQDN